MERRTEIIMGLAAACEALESVAASSTCNLIPEKTLPKGTIATANGDACRLAARATYLVDVLFCESGAQNLQKCCTQAEDDYCDAFDACPD